MNSKAAVAPGVRMTRVLLAMLFAVGVAIGAIGLQGFLSQLTGQSAYASTGFDGQAGQVGALTLADENIRAELEAEEDALNAKKKAFATKKVKGVKLKVKKGKVIVSWKKVKGAMGYEVYASKKKNGKYRLVDDSLYSSTTKTTINTDEKKNSYAFYGKYMHLKSGKKYYFKVRAVKELDEDESTVYSKFSKKVRSKKLK